MSYLSPYLEALWSDFTGGANFAISGSTTLPRNVPFALHVQVQQFLHFKQRCLDLIARGSTSHYITSKARHNNLSSLLVWCR
jgi:hypothetical protein